MPRILEYQLLCSYLGYQTALRLAGQGAHVILACRNAMKAEQAVFQIKQVFVSFS